MRASGFARRTLLIKALAVRSASAVTLQVFRITTWAASGPDASVRPRTRRPAAIPSPSERLARHPKISTWYSATLSSLPTSAVGGWRPKAQSSAEHREQQIQDGVKTGSFSLTRYKHNETANSVGG